MALAARSRRPRSAPAARRVRWCLPHPAPAAAPPRRIRARAGRAGCRRDAPRPARPHIAYRGDSLHRRGRVARAIWRARFGTPLYVYSRGRRCAARSAALPAGARRARPPDLLCREGELEPGRAADVRPRAAAASTSSRAASSSACWPPAATRREIVFSGVGKTRAEMRARARRRRLCFNVESDRRAASRSRPSRRPSGRTARVSLRVNPDVDAETHPYISTGLRGNKFGIAHDRGARRLSPRRAAAGLEVVGIDCHIGSQITEIGPYLDALDRLLDLVEALEAQGIADPPPRPRRRPRHRLRRRDAARRRGSDRARLLASDRRARPRPPQAPVRARPLAGRQRRRARQRGALRQARRDEELLHRRRGDERPDAAGDVRRLDAASSNARAAHGEPQRVRRRRPDLRVGRLARPRPRARGAARRRSSPCSRPAPTR